MQTNEIPMETLLQNSMSPDSSTRTNAISYLMNLQDTQPYLFTVSMLKIFSDEVSNLKFAAGAMLQNSYNGNDVTIQNKIDKRWNSLESAQKSLLKDQFVSMMSTKDGRSKNIASSVLAGIVQIESRSKNLQTFTEIASLVKNSEEIAIGVFTTLSLCVENIGHERIVKEVQRETIFNLMTMESSQKTIDYQLRFFEACIPMIDRQPRHFYDFLIRNKGLSLQLIIRCLTKFLIYFYAKIEFLEEMVDQSISCLNSEFDLDALEFLTTFCELEEIKIKISTIIGNRLLSLLPILLSKLEMEDDFDWNPHRASSCLLEKISNLFSKDLFQIEGIKEFVQNSILEESGIIAFGSIIKKDAQESNFIIETVNFYANAIIILFNSNNTNNLNTNKELESFINAKIKDMDSELFDLYKEKIMWSITKVAITNPNLLSIELVTKLTSLCINNAAKSISACIFLKTICENYAKNSDNVDYDFYFRLLSAMVTASDKMELTMYNLRTALFSALTSAIDACPAVMLPCLDQLLEYLLNKMHEMFEFLGSADSGQFLMLEDVLSNLVQLSQTVIEKRGESLVPLRLKVSMLDKFTRILRYQKSNASADVYISLSFLCCYESFFVSNLDSFMSCAYDDLRNGICLNKNKNGCMNDTNTGNMNLNNIECKVCNNSGTDPATFSSVINFIGDTANVICHGFIKYREIIPVYIQGLGSQSVPNSIKPQMLCTLGDICLAIGSSFSDMLGISLDLVINIFNLNRSENVVYTDNLRSSCCVLISAIVLNLHNEHLFIENEDNLMSFLGLACTEDIDNKVLLNLIYCVSDFVRKRNRKDAWIFLLFEKGMGFDGEIREASLVLKSLLEEHINYN